MLDKLLVAGAVRLPWPTLFEGRLLPGSYWAEAERCRQKCGYSGRACAADQELGEHTCPHGMSYFVHRIDEGSLTVFGVRGPSNNPPFHSSVRDSLKGRSVTNEIFLEWTTALESLRHGMENAFLSRQAEMLDPLHDPMRLAKQVNTIANRLVQQQALGRTFDEKVEKASPELKSLVKASGLLTDSFDLIAIYFNPEAASFGARSAVNPHGLLTKLVSIFRIDDDGLTRHHAKIFLDGECYRNVFVRESFKLIPFALLSNAVKYSLAGSIRVSISDIHTGIEISVESIGPPIEAEERKQIFLKRSRGYWAKRVTDEGRGVGLYLASVIAEAHGFDIKVSSKPTGEYVGDIPLAQNRFYFEVPTSSGSGVRLG